MFATLQDFNQNWNQYINKTVFTKQYINSCNYYYNYLAKQNVSTLLGHHQTYKTVVLVKVYSVVLSVVSHGLKN